MGKEKDLQNLEIVATTGKTVILKGIVDGEERYGMMGPGKTPQDIQLWKDRRALSSALMRGFEKVEPSKPYEDE